MKVGIARTDITPPIGVRLSGFAGRDWRSNGVRDELQSTALWIGDGATTAGVITLDTIGLSIADDAALRRVAGRRAGVAPDHILVACSHTHAGAATMGIRATGDKEVSWTRTVIERAADTLAEARAAATETTRMGIGEAPCDASVNRRSADGFRDPACRVLTLGSEAPVAALFHYAMHPVSLGHADRRLSADWVATARARIEDHLGCPVLFLQGCCGDINPRVRDADLVGAEVGAALRAALAQRRPIPTTLQAGAATASLPFRPIASRAEINAEIAAGKAALAREGQWLGSYQVARAQIDWALRCRALRSAKQDGPKLVNARVPSITLGGVPLIGLPGEVFSEIGGRVRDAVDGAWPIAFAAGNPGYLYPDQALIDGGYEVDLAFRLYGERQAGEGTADALVAAATRAAQGAR